MARRRSVRVCPICSKNNPAGADRCTICGEDVTGVAPRELPSGAWERRPSFGAPERAILGLAAGAFVGFLLAVAPYVDTFSDETALSLALTGNGMVLMVILGLVGGVLAALTARPDLLGIQLSGHAGSRRPCPYCAELIQSRAVICRYCDRRV